MTAEQLSYSRLGAFIRYLWPLFKISKHHKLILNTLQSLEMRKLTRVIISMPPRHGKSLITSEYFPAWYLGRNPDHSIIHAAHTQELADDFGRKVRNSVTSGAFKKIIDVRCSQDSSSKRRFNMVGHRGAYFATGITGPVTGRGADLLIIDDPIKTMEQAESRSQREKMAEWFNSVAYTRLAPGGVIVVIQTRWHQDDLSGYILSNSPEEWTYLRLSAIAEEGDTLGRPEGEALWPEAFPIKTLDMIRNSVGSRVWTSLYQQRPSPEEGSIIKPQWFGRYRTLPFRFDRVIQSWDTAKKVSEVNDYTVCCTFGEFEKKLYLIDVFRMRLEFPDLVRYTQSLQARYEARVLLIEDAASGTSLIQVLRYETSLPVIPIKTKLDKVIRAQQAAPVVESGRVYLPESASWLIDFETEVVQFPHGTFDDQVDAFCQYINWWFEHETSELAYTGKRSF